MMNMTKTTALSDRFPEFAPLPTAAADYDIVRRAIAHIRGNWRSQPAIETIADAAGVSATDLHHLFRRWCGLTPKAFLQALTLNYARELLRASASVLDTAYEVGLSGPGRLHDLFVTHEAMSPGEWKAGGEGLTISYGFHPCPFGTALVMNTPRGLAGLALADAGKERKALSDMRSRWPKARYVEDFAATAATARRIFDSTLWRPQQPLRVVLIGTDFEVRVWEKLLTIPMGALTTYSDLAARAGSPRPRARSAPRSAKIQSASWCPATAWSARTATLPAITGASPASARCWAGKPGWRQLKLTPPDPFSTSPSNPR